ncbi:MAG: type II methionyl aminopeptidase [Candidatus Pacearchaeota archaeon]|nr:type II methionyl aminopeptidase [Candidatus Pacearchaeota archaeon]
MNQKEKQNAIKAGEIASQVKQFAKSFIKADMPLLEIAEKIESQIIKLGGKPAFPVNLSINEIAAHYTPSYNDLTVAKGLLKVDFGVHIDGFIADVAFSLDLENNEENKKLIKASEKALKNAVQKTKLGIPIGEIGKAIQDSIESEGFSPIINLSGHEMQKYELHAGITIPNIDNKKTEKLQKGLYAIEPFVTTGTGKVYDGKPSGIYSLIDSKNVRNPSAREVLNFVEEEYQTLPFCSRWIVKKFGIKSLFALKQLEDNRNLNHFQHLIEASHNKVSQSEETILVDDKITITTE